MGAIRLVFSPDEKFLAARYGYSAITDTTPTLFGMPVIKTMWLKVQVKNLVMLRTSLPGQ